MKKTWSKFLKPTKGKIILSIIFFAIYSYYTLTNSFCPSIGELCVVDAGTLGAYELPPGSGNYVTAAIDVPLSCYHVCNNGEYTWAIIKTTLFSFIIPILIIYIISAFLSFAYNRVRK